MARLRSDVVKLVNLLVDVHGCTARRSKTGHWQVTRPGFQPVSMSGTPSDQRAIRNMRSDVQRYLGIDLSA